MAEPLADHSASRPSGTVTFLFTDIEGSTRSWDEHRVEMRAALARHDAILREAIDSCHGWVFSTGGDGVAAAFQTSKEAVAAAIAAQRALQVEPWPAPISIRVRMGVHTGETDERDGDYFGPPVNRAARIMAAARGSQIVLSQVTMGVLGQVEDVQLIDLGVHRLRGVIEPLRLFGVAAEGVEWIDLPLASEPELRSRLPRPATEWFGSAAAIRQMAAELSTHRLVTLTGAGGVGKTRTALELGWSVSEDFPDGVWYHELAAITDPDLVVTSVASTMRIQSQPGLSTIQSIVDWLGSRRLLMILDNCEHVLAPVSELTSAVIAACDSVTVLTTSREPLGVGGEQVVAVHSLAPPVAVDLFCDRARAADADVVFDDVDLAAVVSICERLDGIPLAIELAAARVRSAAPVDVLARLDDRFRLLRRSARGGLERHQTLRATVAWSYLLLSDAEQTLFDRLSVFAGTFDAEAVAAVTADGAVDPRDVVDTLDGLVDKSTVVADRRSSGTRYSMLETLRQYAEERLIDRGDVARVRDRHLAHYVDVAERTHQIEMSPRQMQADERFDLEWDNLRAAHQWAIATSDVAAADRIVGLLGRYATSRMRHEHGEWAEATIRIGRPDAPAGPLTYGNAGRWAMIAGEYHRSIELCDAGVRVAARADQPEVALPLRIAISSLESLDRIDAATIGDMIPRLRAILDGTDDPWLRCYALEGAAVLLMDSDPLAARPYADQMASEAARVRAPHLLMFAAWMEARVKLDVDHDAEGALALSESTLGLARQVGDLLVEGGCLQQMVLIRWIGRLRGVGAACHRAVDFLYDVRVWTLLSMVIELSAGYLVRVGKTEPAALVYGHLEQHYPSVKGEYFRTLRAEGVEAVGRLNGAADLAARGAAMSRDEMVAILLAHLPAA